MLSLLNLCAIVSGMLVYYDFFFFNSSEKVFLFFLVSIGFDFINLVLIFFAPFPS